MSHHYCILGSTAHDAPLVPQYRIVYLKHMFTLSKWFYKYFPSFQCRHHKHCGFNSPELNTGSKAPWHHHLTHPPSMDDILPEGSHKESNLKPAQRHPLYIPLRWSSYWAIHNLLIYQRPLLIKSHCQGQLVTQQWLIWNPISSLTIYIGF